MENREYDEKGTTPPEQVVDPYERYICKLDRIKRMRHPPIIQRDGVYIGN
jgi:hypothetical protein